MRLLTGTVVRFDETRGYGFIAPDGGGEDVFMHANSLYDDKHEFTPGAAVEFQVADGERGLKALAVRIVRRRPIAAMQAATPHRPKSSDGEGLDGMCDVLTSAEFSRELTDGLLDAAPSLTGTQILHVRTALVGLARKHGWVDD